MASSQFTENEFQFLPELIRGVLLMLLTSIMLKMSSVVEDGAADFKDERRGQSVQRMFPKNSTLENNVAQIHQR